MDRVVFQFHRQKLAEAYCDSLQGKGLLDARSGLFLAAPRRTGKSTFLREDMVPEMQARGWITVYVDLWSDRATDPAVLIANAVKAKIATYASVISKLAKSTGLERVNVFGALTLNMSASSLPAGLTLADALQALSEAGKAPVALVVDEAQHAISTPAGLDAMFALKAARDHMNQGVARQGLFLVLTGSNRDKLAHLVIKRTQPFFGSAITKFPLLERVFTEAYTAHVNAQLAATNQFSSDDMYEAFKIVGHRPEVLRTIVGEIALGAGAEHLGRALRDGADEIKHSVFSAMQSDFEALSPVQRAVLEVLIAQGKDFAPFTSSAMQAYAKILGKDKVSTAAVQTALDALRDKGLIWRASVGDYALEDESMAHWYKAKHSARG